jgi:hypothetical protein
MVFGNSNDMVFIIPLLCIHVIGRGENKNKNKNFMLNFFMAIGNQNKIKYLCGRQTSNLPY